jgi:hypothetical protein
VKENIGVEYVVFHFFSLIVAMRLNQARRHLCGLGRS